MVPRAQFRESLEALRVDVDAVGRMARDAVGAAFGALVADDRSLALRVVAGDDRIDALFVALEERAYSLIAREAPVATDLRFLMSALRVMSDYEKIGDRAVAIAKSALTEWNRESTAVTLLGRMGDVALDLLGAARLAWLEHDLSIAGELKRRDDEVDACYRTLVSHLLRQEGPGAALLLLHGHTTGRNLERIADHAVMIAERVSYLVTGDPSALAAEIR
jgi:phosphate transport system protein